MLPIIIGGVIFIILLVILIYMYYPNETSNNTAEVIKINTPKVNDTKNTSSTLYFNIDDVPLDTISDKKNFIHTSIDLNRKYKYIMDEALKVFPPNQETKKAELKRLQRINTANHKQWLKFLQYILNNTNIEKWTLKNFYWSDWKASDQAVELYSVFDNTERERIKMEANLKYQERPTTMDLINQRNAESSTSTPTSTPTSTMTDEQIIKNLVDTNKEINKKVISEIDGTAKITQDEQIVRAMIDSNKTMTTNLTDQIEQSTQTMLDNPTGVFSSINAALFDESEKVKLQVNDAIAKTDGAVNCRTIVTQPAIPILGIEEQTTSFCSEGFKSSYRPRTRIEQLLF